MKALVLSDSHRYFGGIARAMENESDIDLIIHAGDVQQDVDDIMAAWSNIPCAYVIGNNDYFVHDVPDKRIFSFDGKRIFLTHGHLFGVKLSLNRLILAAKEANADICIFGHTHTSYLEETEDMLILNPGSCFRSYAVLEINDGRVRVEIKKI